MEQGANAIRRRAACALLAATAAAALVLAPGVRAASQCANAGPWCNRTLSPDARAGLLLARLTESQKISLLAGNDALGVTGASGHTGSSAGVPSLVPSVNFTDGTAGIRQGSATAVPVELALAASFDPHLARLDGALLGNEARHKGNDVIYGPTLTIMRTPLAGRTFQALGEDPYLTSQLGDAMIEGIQGTGVIANANIFVANNQEGQDPTGETGMPGVPLGAGGVGSRYAVNAVVDQRTLREIYLAPFESAVRQAHVGTVMCAYNMVNGVYNCEDGALLNQVLKGQWGFKGFVLSDYGAAHNTVASLGGGLDFDPWPGVAYSPPLVTAALTSGLATQAELDDHVRRYLRTLFAAGFFDRAAYTDDEGAINRAAHAREAERIAAGTITLLRNERGVLPLSRRSTKSIAVIGKVASSFITGGGSSNVTPYSSVTPLAGIERRAAAARIPVAYDDASNVASAVALARRSSVAVVVVAKYETEGADLQCLTLECPDAYGDQDSLIQAVAAANPRTVVVLETGGPVLTPWRSQVRGLLEAWYPGEQGGSAIAHVLFGDIDPSGHLPVTFPAAESQEPTSGDPSSYPGVGTDETYREGVLVGYRWFDARRLAPAYPFGYGLSYTRFSFSGMRIRRTRGGWRVGLTIANTGSRGGSAVAQLYVALPSLPGVVEPPSQLAAFAKVALAPGQRRRVYLNFGPRALSFWDDARGSWRSVTGCVRVMAGPSSRDLPLHGLVAPAGADCAPDSPS